MELDKYDLREGLKYVCGKWKADYVVNFFSDDLAHIPATEFKSDDGKDFSSLSFEFDENHNVCIKIGDEEKAKGSWEQTSLAEIRCHFDEFNEIPDGWFKDNAETMSMIEGDLCFTIGFLTIGMKKTEQGEVTKEVAPADKEQSAEDLALNAVVGVYEITKAMSVVGGKFGTFTVTEILADAEKQLSSGSMSKREYSQMIGMYKSTIEFTEDHKVVNWMPVPEGVSEDLIKAEIKNGNILMYKDGCFVVDEPKEWKAVDGKYYYNTRQHREMMGEMLSPWDEISENENGEISLDGGMMFIKKIK